MKLKFTLLSGMCILLWSTTPTFAQLETFQILYQTDFFTHCYDVAPTLDQGYIITGFEDKPAPFNVPLVPYLCKIDCTGEVEWIRKYGITTGLDNSDPRVTTLSTGDYIMMNTVLDEDYDVFMVRTAPNGNAYWRKTYGGNDKDVARGLVKLRDDNLIIVGSTYSYGTDIGSFYSDMYALKINYETGDTIWTKTYGNPGGIDDLWGGVESENGELTFVGRSFYDNGIWLTLIHTDANGNIIWTKNYGKTNHHAQGFDIIQLEDGGFAFTGFTTLAKQDFNAISDVQVIRTDADGEIKWAKVYHGSAPDLGEIGSTILSHADTLVIALESSSYPTPNQDITKQLLYFLDEETGDLLHARSFNDTGGQFPMIRKDWKGYIMSGMTDEFPGSWNDPILRKLDENFESGCQETDWTSQTQTEEPSWEVDPASFTISSGSFVSDYFVDSLATNYVDSTFCFSGEVPTECELFSDVPTNDFSNQFLVYPNPTSGFVTIEISERLAGSVQVELFNLNGQLIQSNAIEHSSNFVLDIHEVPTGIYFLQLKTQIGVFVQKLEKF